MHTARPPRRSRAALAIALTLSALPFVACDDQETRPSPTAAAAKTTACPALPSQGPCPTEGAQCGYFGSVCGGFSSCPDGGTSDSRCTWTCESGTWTRTSASALPPCSTAVGGASGAAGKGGGAGAAGAAAGAGSAGGGAGAAGECDPKKCDSTCCFLDGKAVEVAAGATCKTWLNMEPGFQNAIACFHAPGGGACILMFGGGCYRRVLDGKTLYVASPHTYTSIAKSGSPWELVGVPSAKECSDALALPDCP